MAFRATYRAQPSHRITYQAAEQPQSSAALDRNRAWEDSHQEWVLFSPIAPSTACTEATWANRTLRKTGLSLISDVASLESGLARTINVSAVDETSDDATDQDEDLDSLDDGLYAFHELTDVNNPAVWMMREIVLPTHDGFGAFAESGATQDHLRQIEKYLPRRKHRRRSSVLPKLEALQEVEEQDGEAHRIERIEQWRLDQGRALLEEIERETRHMSRTMAQRSNTNDPTDCTYPKSDLPRTTSLESPQPCRPFSTVIEHDLPENESGWKRYTRKAIRDLFGIDDALLSTILGESLLEHNQSTSTLAVLPLPTSVNKEPEHMENLSISHSTWQERLLRRLAREIGVLIHQISEHPGAFSTYLQTQEPPPFLALASTSTPAVNPLAPSPNSLLASGERISSSTNQQYAIDQADPSSWGIEEDAESDKEAATSVDNAAQLHHEREYWEKDLDVRMVFNFLKSRFCPNLRISSQWDIFPSDSSHSGVIQSVSSTKANCQPAHYSTDTTMYPAQRAAIIRQHHPLASGNLGRQQDRTPLSHHHTTGITRRVARTATSSCASQSTRKSKRSSSSRHYWNVAGSIASSGAGLPACSEVII